MKKSVLFSFHVGYWFVLYAGINLFNSLNDIDILIIVNPEKASHALLKLSDMMRYMLYNANTDKVELTQETAYLQQYVSLQHLRLPNPDLVELQIRLQLHPIFIAPCFLFHLLRMLNTHNRQNKYT